MRGRHRRVALLPVLAACVGSSVAHAQNADWVGNGGNRFWSNPGNWSPGLPGTTGVASFIFSSNNSPILDSNRTVATLTFRSLFNYDLSAANGAVLSVGSVFGALGVTNEGIAAATVSAPITTLNTCTSLIDVNSGSLTLAGPLTLAAQRTKFFSTFNPNSTLHILGPLTIGLQGQVVVQDSVGTVRISSPTITHSAASMVWRSTGAVVFDAPNLNLPLTVGSPGLPGNGVFSGTTTISAEPVITNGSTVNVTGALTLQNGTFFTLGNGSLNLSNGSSFRSVGGNAAIRSTGLSGVARIPASATVTLSAAANSILNFAPYAELGANSRIVVDNNQGTVNFTPLFNAVASTATVDVRAGDSYGEFLSVPFTLRVGGGTGSARFTVGTDVPVSNAIQVFNRGTLDLGGRAVTPSGSGSIVLTSGATLVGGGVITGSLGMASTSGLTEPITISARAGQTLTLPQVNFLNGGNTVVVANSPGTVAFTGRFSATTATTLNFFQSGLVTLSEFSFNLPVTIGTNGVSGGVVRLLGLTSFNAPLTITQGAALEIPSTGLQVLTSLAPLTLGPGARITGSPANISIQGPTTTVQAQPSTLFINHNIVNNQVPGPFNVIRNPAITTDLRLRSVSGTFSFSGGVVQLDSVSGSVTATGGSRVSILALPSAATARLGVASNGILELPFGYTEPSAFRISFAGGTFVAPALSVAAGLVLESSAFTNGIRTTLTYTGNAAFPLNLAGNAARFPDFRWEGAYNLGGRPMLISNGSIDLLAPRPINAVGVSYNNVTARFAPGAWPAFGGSSSFSGTNALVLPSGNAGFDGNLNVTGGFTSFTTGSGFGPGAALPIFNFASLTTAGTLELNGFSPSPFVAFFTSTTVAATGRLNVLGVSSNLGPTSVAGALFIGPLSSIVANPNLGPSATLELTGPSSLLTGNIFASAGASVRLQGQVIGSLTTTELSTVLITTPETSQLGLNVGGSTTLNLPTRAAVSFPSLTNTGTFSIISADVSVPSRIVGGAGTINLAAGVSLTAPGIDQRFLNLSGTAASPTAVNLASTTATTSILQTLSIASDLAPLGSRKYFGLVDLGRNDLILRATNLTDAAVNLAAARDMVRAFLVDNAGLPGDSGLGSSAAFYGLGADAFATLAVYSNQTLLTGIAALPTFNGISITTNDVLVKYTYLGDVNIDGVVDASDIARILQGMNGGGTGWNFGDVNYDGVVNATDLGRAMAALRGQGAPLNGVGSGGGGGAPIPEPSALSMLVLPALLLRRRC